MSVSISFREDDAFPLARESFVRMCGFGSGTEKHRKMLDSAMKIRELGAEKIILTALLSECEPSVIGEAGFEVDGFDIKCDSIFLMEKERIHKVIFYIVTAGECGCESEQILDRVYADFWGTAYVDAAYELLRKDIEARCCQELVLSEAFGPGYYGMPTDEIKNIFHLLKGEKIGVKCLESCVMVPVKSCAGILFVMEKGTKMPETCCRDCLGNRSGCRYCSVLHNMQGGNK